MVTTAIPERVFALCKIVEKRPIYSSELKNKMEPEFLGTDRYILMIIKMQLKN